MGIDKIGPINNYNNYNKVNKKNSINNINSNDSVNISSEAISKAIENRALEIVNKAPDIRIDKINEIKEKINNPDYIDKIIAESLADKIMDALGI